MEKQVAYTNTLKPSATHTRKTAKPRPIPKGYMSMDEFSTLFHRKLDEAKALTLQRGLAIKAGRSKLIPHD